MAALTQDKRTDFKEGVEIPAKVKAATKIYAGANVCINNGYLVPGADTAGLIFHGVARQNVDNSLGANGDLSALVRRRGLINMKFATAISQADVGANVFLVDDQLVDLTGNVTNNIFCGNLAEFVDSTHGFVDIEPAIIQGAVATHISDAEAAHAASAISVVDADNNFAAAEGTVELALKKLASGPFLITVPKFTGWVKDGTAKTIALPLMESPVPIIVKRAYVNLGTAPGTGKTLAILLNESALLSITEANTQGEAESLAIAVAKDVDLVITVNETASGAAANCDIILVAKIDDGE